MPLAYEVVDVFTRTPLEGNALAVFPDARGLDTATMQRIAREMNLSETTFVTPPQSDAAVARVRIFTPFTEMLFAGHPTVGTADVLRRRGVLARETSTFIFEENVGPVSVRIGGDDDPIIWLSTPPIAAGKVFEHRLCAAAAGLALDDLRSDVPCQVLSAGNPNLFVCATDPEAVDRARIDPLALRRLFAYEAAPVCFFLFAPTPGGAYSRMFAPDLGVPEDPATGSATGPLAAFMMRHALVRRTDGTRFISEQGTKMGRRSLLHVVIRGDDGRDAIEVGGHVTPVATATMTL